MAKLWKQSTLNEILRLLEDGKLYLFVGAGLSKLAGYPLWDELLKDFADEYKSINSLRVPSDDVYPELLSLAASKNPKVTTQLRMLGTEGLKGYGRVLTKHFYSERHAEQHEALLRLPFAGYLTINYDRCLESAWKKVRGRVCSNSEWLCFPPHEKSALRNVSEIMSCTKKNGFILHIHGCIYHQDCLDIENIILNNEQYTKYYADNYVNGLQDIFDNILNQHMLILGTSFNDPYFFNRFLGSRDPLDLNRVNRRKRAYIIFHKGETSENDYSPRTDKEVLDLEHIYYEGAREEGLKVLISELKEAYEAGKRTVILDNKSNNDIYEEPSIK